MKRMLFAALGVFAIAAAANAASLSVQSDKLTYLVGETITLTVPADDAGATTYAVFGRLHYSGALVDNGTRSQLTLAAQSGFSWTKGALYGADDGIDAFSDVFNQVAPGYTGETATNLPGTIATVTLIAASLGVVNVDWNTDSNSGFQLTFFGLTDAPGTSFTIVPEPATGALLGLGLVALAGRRARLPRDI